MGLVYADIELINGDDLALVRYKITRFSTTLPPALVKFSVNDAAPLDDLLKWSTAELKKHVIPFFQLSRAE